MKVLIAEDDSTSAIVLRKALEKLGHEAIVATDGEQAYTLLAQDTQFAYRVVISDWMMPGMDGLELTRKLREEREVGDPCRFVILLTARGRPEDRRMGLEAGADDFMVKPLDMGDLIPRLSIAERMLKLEDALADTKNAPFYGGVTTTTPAPDVTTLETAAQEALGEEAAKQILFAAVRDFDASEVHFEPRRDGTYRIRGRVADGTFRSIPTDTDMVRQAIPYLTIQANSKAKKTLLRLSDDSVISVSLTVVELIDSPVHILVRVLNDSLPREVYLTQLSNLPMSAPTRERLQSILLRGRGNGGVLVVASAFPEADLAKQTMVALRNQVDNEDSLTLDANYFASGQAGLINNEMDALRLRPDYLFARTDRGAGIAVLLHGCLTQNTFGIASITLGQLPLIENRFNNIEYGYVPVASRRVMFVLDIKSLSADGSNASDRYELTTAAELFAA